MFEQRRPTQPLPLEPQVRENRDHIDGGYLVTLKPTGKLPVEFGTATSGVESFTQPPHELSGPLDLLDAARSQNTTIFSEQEHVYTLDQALHFDQALAGGGHLEYVFTGDHHELYYFLLQHPESTHPQDILVNLDSHHDAGVPHSTTELSRVSLADFVTVGAANQTQQTWGEYHWVAAAGAHDQNQADLPIPYYQHQADELMTALHTALQHARAQGSKVILTIDLDFFASGEISGHDFNHQAAAETLIYIFRFLQEYSQDIRLVHFSESLAYAKEQNTQIAALYQTIAALMVSLQS